MFLVELVKDLIISLVWWVILFPIVYLVVTRSFLCLSSLDKEPFWKSVQNGYRRVTRFWVDKGLLYSPF